MNHTRENLLLRGVVGSTHKNLLLLVGCGFNADQLPGSPGGCTRLLVQGEGAGRSRQWQEGGRYALVFLSLDCSWTCTSETALLGLLSGIASFPSPMRTALPHMGQALPPAPLAVTIALPAPPGCHLPTPQLGFQTRLHKQDVHGLAERGLQLRWWERPAPSQPAWRCRRLLWHSPICLL